MAQTQYQLLAALERHFDEVIQKTEALLSRYEAHQGAAWALNEPTPNVDWLRRALFDFWYLDGQDGRVTRTYVGLIAADQGLLEAVGALNQAKSSFSEQIGLIQAKDPGLIPEVKSILPFRHPALHNHLRGSGLARLHLKQCWRHLPVADAELSRVRLAWYSSGRSIKRVSVPEAEQMLQKYDSEAPHIQIQLRKLAGIPSLEPLAKVQKQAPLMRANLFFREPLADGRMRRAMNVALPVFIPSTDGSLPDYNQVAPFPPEKRTRAKRSDERLEEEPFLPSVHIYRYRSQPEPESTAPSA
ncbi:hypothetical protein DFO67_12419 [Modicisalibacter xianhensis]|uniref:DNA replication terminus site binding protein n=1 Tax=Modicisalibacter xianhensis TaxID=442341 RepID=A0A4R8FEL7_9GAMM|nr:DNA replication terminus site-binding protein [Halomonas xianhensis]TDX23702.1 hypothetical protein DFO67_12419 [Halomonas xianhensis]